VGVEAENRYRLGTGKYRLGTEPHEVRTSFTISEEHELALSRLKCARGCPKNEVIGLALDLVFSLSPDDIASMIKERRIKRS